MICIERHKHAMTEVEPVNGAELRTVCDAISDGSMQTSRTRKMARTIVVKQNELIDHGNANEMAGSRTDRLDQQADIAHPTAGAVSASVNVGSKTAIGSASALDSTFDRAALGWLSCMDDLSSLLVDYGTGDDQVVPLLLCPSSEADSVELRSLFAAHHNYAETVLVRTHQYSLSFGLTNFKLQGRTLQQLILSLCHRTKTPYMTLAAFYVLVSRVRRFSALRLLYHDQAGLDKVSWLQHDPYLYAWVRGYDRANGRWSDTLAASALRDVRAMREAAKARMAEAKKTKAARAKAARAKVAQGKKAAPGKQAEAAKRQQLDASRPPKKARTQQPDAQPASVTGSALGLPPAGASVQTSTPPASSSARPPPKCTLCGQLGHTFRGCKRPRDDSAGAPAAPSRIGAAANHTSHGSASGERNGCTGN